VSSNDKTADLLVATTRATKAETTPDSSGAEAAPVTKKAPAKKTAAKKKVVSKKAPAKKVAAKKTPAKKATKSQKETLVATFTFGQRVWPD
jgi:RNA polymerase primary sigma factor